MSSNIPAPRGGFKGFPDFPLHSTPLLYKGLRVVSMSTRAENVETTG